MSRAALLKRFSLLVRTLAGVLVLLLAVGVFGFLRSTRPLPAQTELVAEVPRVPVMVTTLEPVARVWPGYGTVRAMDAANVPTQVSARVLRRPEGVEDGSRIAAGDTLLELDPEDFDRRIDAINERIEGIKARLSSLETEEGRLRERVELTEEQADIRRAELERVRRAVERGAATDADVDLRRAQYLVARQELSGIRLQLDQIEARRRDLQSQERAEQAELAVARLQRERTEITSPIDGYIQEILFKTDEWAPAGSTVARVVGLGRVEIPLLAPISAAGRLRVGDTVEVRVEGDGGSSFIGEVSRLAPESREGSRSVTVFVEVRQEEPETLTAGGDGRTVLRPGQFVTAQLRSGEPTQRVIVPRRAVRRDAVMVVLTEAGSNGDVSRVVERPVIVSHHIEGERPELARGETQWSVIQSGLEAGETVVIGGLDTLREGLRVEPVPAGVSSASESTEGAGDS